MGVLATTLWAAAALAEEAVDAIRPPEQQANDAAMMSTRDAPAGDEKPHESLPWSKPEESTATKPAAPSGSSGKPANYKPTMPFSRPDYLDVQVPKGPRSVTAVPVENVDAIETSEPAPPTPVAPEADPAQENPENPTELTAPIFEKEAEPRAPRSIIIRALNKVTAQSQLYKLKPAQTMLFGQLEITAVTCQASSEKSQTDYAGLFSILERMPTGQAPKPLFRGWMYASSPSITALEHPVYDVTMVRCEVMPAGEKPKEKQDKKR